MKWKWSGNGRETEGQWKESRMGNGQGEKQVNKIAKD